MSGRRESHRTHEVGVGADRLTSRRVDRVHRVPAGDHHADAARGKRTGGLGEKVIVDGQPAARVIGLIEQPVGAKRDVADRCGDLSVGEGNVGERPVDHLVASGEPGFGNLGGGGVQLDAGHRGAVGGERHEYAASAAGLECRPVVGRRDGVPHGLGDPWVGVVRVERGALGRCEPVGSNEFLQLGALGGPVRVGEDLWCCAPAVPAGHQCLIGGAVSKRTQHLEVVVHRSPGRQPLLGCGLKRRFGPSSVAVGALNSRCGSLLIGQLTSARGRGESARPAVRWVVEVES